MQRCIIVLLLSAGLSVSNAQGDSAFQSTRGRRLVVGGISGAAAAGSLFYLHHAWYAGYNTGSFHLFNDNAEWLQMDKAGHAYSGYQVSRLMMDAFHWAGFSERAERWVGGTTGLAYLTAIEIMDGYSRGWGFSWGDMGANVAGSALAIAQEALWDEQRIHLKFSYRPSGIARYNPDLLGGTAFTRLVKDYNAQAYWISFGAALFKISGQKFPPWLMCSFGYAAHGMTGGHENTAEAKDAEGNVVTLTRERVFLFSIDLDLTKVRTRSRFLRGLFSAANVLKLPFPAIGFSKSGINGYLLR